MACQMKARVREGIIHSPFPAPSLRSETLFDFIRESIETHEEKTALVEDERQLSYVEFMESLKRCAGGLQRLGVGRGDRVYCDVQNSIDGFIAMCAIACTGAAIVTGSQNKFEDQYMSKAGVTHVLTDEVNGSLSSRKHKILCIKGWLSLGDIPGCTNIKRFQSMSELDFVAPDAVCNGSVMLVSCSSGTADAPRAIELSTQSVILQAEAQKLAKFVNSDDVVYSCDPICQFFGFTKCLLTIHCGATAVIDRYSSDARAMISCIKKHKVTRLITRWPLLTEVVLGIATKEFTAPSVKAVLCSGATSSSALGKKILTTFPAIVEFRNTYDMTEMCGPIASSHPGVVSPLNNGGFPMPNIKMKVISTESGNVMGPMELGEVLVHSDTKLSIPRYTQKPEETISAFMVDDWFRTGDLGFYNEDGCIFLRGRIETSIRCAERVVSPCQLEEILLSHPDVLDAAVFGVPRFGCRDGTRQESRTEEKSLTALVVAAKGRCPDPCFASELKRFVAERVKPGSQLSGGVFFVDQVPRTAMGTIERDQLLPKLDCLLLCGKFS